MLSILLRVFLSCLLILNASCKDRESAAKVSAAEVINAGHKGIYVIRPFNEVWGRHKNEAIKVAFDLVKSEIRRRYPNVDANDGMDFLRDKVDLQNAEDQAVRFIEANVDEIEGIGLKISDFVPSAFMFVFSGPIVEELLNRSIKLPVETDILLTLIVVPQFVQRYVPSSQKLMESWRFKLGAGLLTFARLAKKDNQTADTTIADAASKKPFRFGMGFVWGGIKDPSELSGKLAGVAMSRATWSVPYTGAAGKIPFGNNVKVFALSSAKNGWLQDETGKISLFKITNVMATFEYIMGEQKYNNIYGYAGVSLTSEQILSYLLGSAELASEEKPSAEDPAVFPKDIEIPPESGIQPPLPLKPINPQPNNAP